MDGPTFRGRTGREGFAKARALAAAGVVWLLATGAAAGLAKADGNADPGPLGFVLAGPGELPSLSRGPALALLDLAPALARMTPGPPAAIVPAALTSPKVSGLAWRSGMSCGSASLAAWRGRKLDTTVLFINHDSWDQMRGSLKSSYVTAGVALTPQVVISLPMMPRSESKQHAACAQGKFDGYFREFGSLLVKAGAGSAVVRLGWEANESTSHPWAISTAAEIANYKTCFRREVAALRSTAPRVKIEWTNSKRGKLPFSMLEMYPGGDVVDLWGLNYYNTYPVVKSQADWDAFANATGKGGAPLGIAQWVKAATAHGRKLAVSEWGLWNRDGLGAQADQPVYIANMFKFFAANAAKLEYENYYNCPRSTRLGPETDFPKASGTYQQLWSAR